MLRGRNDAYSSYHSPLFTTTISAIAYLYLPYLIAVESSIFPPF
jgi:hypothetical protein